MQLPPLALLAAFRGLSSAAIEACISYKEKYASAKLKSDKCGWNQTQDIMRQLWNHGNINSGQAYKACNTSLRIRGQFFRYKKLRICEFVAFERNFYYNEPYLRINSQLWARVKKITYY
jgi:hypothetical protein